MVKKKVQGLEGNRRMSQTTVDASTTRVISVTSGKGGVGKTNIVGNLALALRRLGKKVLVLDGDLGLANIDIIFGLSPAYNIKHVINGERNLSEVMMRGPEDIQIIPAGSGVQDLVHLTQGQKLNLLNEFDSLDENFDILLIDTGAGISSNVIYFSIAADERIVVATSEPTSITDAYALIKVMYTKHGTNTFKLLVNMVEHDEEGRSVFENLSNAIVRFLKGISLEYVGFIPRDSNVEKAVRQQSTVLTRYPESSSSRSFVDLANRLNASQCSAAQDGNIKFFWKKLIAR
ncbi:MAG: MinD/ParA family protein [Deltaproteobacteria bacterium]|nr:MinD/ParA family protein [Deltaproteobacteria bacterium]